MWRKDDGRQHGRNGHQSKHTIDEIDHHIECSGGPNHDASNVEIVEVMLDLAPK